MRHRTSLNARGAVVAVVCVLGWPGTSSAAGPGAVSATLACRPEAAPGRVLCELRVLSGPGARLTWADALVTAAPDFARPLRSRVAAERFAGDGSRERKLSLAFIATSPGAGRVTVKARAVVCAGPAPASECRPEARELSAEIRVGS